MWENYKLQQCRAAGRGAVNGWLSLPCPFMAEAFARQGWDSLTIDMQHGLIDFAAAAAMLSAISAAADSAADAAADSKTAGKTTPLVRVPWLDESGIMKALDAGAHGVICPMVNSAADARRLAAAARYPPDGARSFGPIRARQTSGEQYHDKANAEVLVLAMIETREAVECADEILSTPGIDGAYVGPADLACSLGCAPSFTPDAPPVVAAIERILAAAKKRGAFAGVHTGAPDYARKMLAAGFDMATVMSDLRLLNAAAADVLAKTRAGK